MMFGSKGTPVLYNYLKKYQENPRSRIFAPLAEAYRKAGLLDEAIEIAREGLQIHPHFVGGKVALARAYFDKRRYQDVLTILGSVIEEVPDNLIAQRLVAESSLMCGEVKGALHAYKMILFYHPEDHETAKLVFELETQAYQKGEALLKPAGHNTSHNVSSIHPMKRQHALEVLRKLLSQVQRM